MNKYLAELLGSFWLNFISCGAILLAANSPELQINFFHISLILGLTLSILIYTLGHISGSHLNPVVSIGFLISGKMDKKDFIPYIIAQQLGSIVALTILLLLAGNISFFEVLQNTYTFHNSYGKNMTIGLSTFISILGCLLFLGFYLFIIMGTTDKKTTFGFAPFAIGLTLSFINFTSPLIYNVCLNPVFNSAVALLQLNLNYSQILLFWIAPLLGGALGTLTYLFMTNQEASLLSHCKKNK